MGTVDLGDPLPDLAVEIRNAAGTLENATTVVLTLTQPDQTSSTPAVTNPSAGRYVGATTITTQRGRVVANWVASGVNASAFTTVYNVVDPAASIVSLRDAQAFLNSFLDAEQDTVRATVEAASTTIERYTDRKWRRSTVVETYDGGETALILRSYPPVAVTAVTELGVAVTDFTLDPAAGLLYRGAGASAGGRCWYSAPQAVTVTYTVGPAAVPEDITAAVLEVTRVLWEQRRGGTRQQADEEPADLIPRPTRLLLDTYRTPGIA